MIKSIHFKNFRVLRDCTLPLGQFTLLIGPNGCGKSTALASALILGNPAVSWERLASVGAAESVDEAVQVMAEGGCELEGGRFGYKWVRGQGRASAFVYDSASARAMADRMKGIFSSARVFSLDAKVLAGAVQLQPEMTLAADGAGLAGVLDRLRDQHPERWEAMNDELHFWMPEFDRVLFETPGQGTRSIQLRMTEGGHPIPAQDLSQGTLLALAILTIAYAPNPPLIVGLEEPDRGLHPRLLRVVRDAMYRLAYPADHEDKRPAVQVIATTHSPYMLDQFKDHPEEVVIANRVENSVKFERLSDRDDLEEILKDSVLGDVWYSGILGGVPSQP